MHALIEDVLPFFLAFYVFDSLAWARAHELLFLRRLASFARYRDGLQIVGLLPVAEVIAAFELPVRFGHTHVAWENPDGWRQLPWDALGEVRIEERSVRSAGGIALRMPSREAANWVAATLRAGREARPEARVEACAALLARGADLAALRRLRAAHLRHARPLEWLGGALLVGVFGVVPLAAYSKWTGRPSLIQLLLALVVMHAAVLALSWRTLRGCGVAPRTVIETLAPLLLFPPSSAHARSVVGRNLYAAFDPLAVASVLLPQPALVVMARERYHALHLRRGPEGDFADDLRLREQAWKRIVSAAGLDADEVLRAPPPQDRSAALYCPVCSTEYRAGVHTCSDCDAPLAPLGV